MAHGARQDDDELITAINVTPLVDIVLVLLIVLMVTSSYLVHRSINVDLPKAATGEPTEPTLLITIDAEGKLYLDGTSIGTTALVTRIRAAYQQDPAVKAIIAADGRVPHARVVTVIDLLRRERITKFGINTDPLEEPVTPSSP